MEIPDRPKVDMDIDLEDFFRSKVPQLIDSVNGEEQAQWGMMSVQHMLEHLVLPLSFAIGTLKVAIYTPEEKLPRQREFLHSAYALPKNFQAPFLKAGENPPLMCKSLEEAKALLKDTVVRFLDVVNDPAFATEAHPVFGLLDRQGWLVFQYKHFTHHFSQFGLLP